MDARIPTFPNAILAILIIVAEEILTINQRQFRQLMRSTLSLSRIPRLILHVTFLVNLKDGQMFDIPIINPSNRGQLEFFFQKIFHVN